MNILIDASCLMKELTGVGVYTLHFLDALFKIDSGNVFHLFFNAMKGELPLMTRSLPGQVTIRRRRFPGKLLLEHWRHFRWPTIETLAGSGPVDVFHSPNFLYQPSACGNVVTTVHDVAFLKSTSYGSRYAGGYHRELLAEHITRARHIITCSGAVRKDLLDLFNLDESRVTVIYHGIDPEFHGTDDPEAVHHRLQKAGYPDRYILSVGTVEPRKNFPFLIRAFHKAMRDCENTRLVIVGRHAEGAPEILRLIRELHLEDRVVLPGYVPGFLLPDLYRGADLCLFPSWDEGFGIPPIEAAACGAPIAVSDIPVFHEILGDAALFFPLDDVETCAAWICRIVQDEAFAAARRESGRLLPGRYSWDEAARKHLKVYEAAAT
mgnify:CR=1 FL=1